MWFKQQIPDELYEDNDNLKALINVLDGLHAYKNYEVDRHSLFYKSLLIGDTSWLAKRLEDYGYPTIPALLPKQCMDAMLINARNVMSLKGSDLGLRYFLWCLTFGRITIDWENFYPPANNLTLSEFTGKGFLLADNPDEVDNVNYLMANEQDVGSQILNVTVTSMYWNNPYVLDYINTNIRRFLNFTEDSFQFNLQMVQGPYVPMDEPYWYFVNRQNYEAVNIDPDGIDYMIIEDTFIIQ